MVILSGAARQEIPVVISWTHHNQNVLDRKYISPTINMVQAGYFALVNM